MHLESITVIRKHDHRGRDWWNWTDERTSKKEITTKNGFFITKIWIQKSITGFENTQCIQSTQRPAKWLNCFFTWSLYVMENSRCATVSSVSARTHTELGCDSVTLRVLYTGRFSSDIQTWWTQLNVFSLPNNHDQYNNCCRKYAIQFEV